ncbi:MAG: transposase [Candidatus Cloacimonetes bacterium HGW-Cloacimonetes-3]|jgi:REP element-mobilizing transposase RayT|nr:MAG: transposase [Candidatus Cloacimonetes bacterium HGW-Cloacimonetes-3]
MSHSVSVVYLHLVFSTKDRQPHIVSTWQNELYAYIGGIIKNLQSQPIIINGTTDHIHILCTLPREMDIATFMRNMKASSSKWVHQHHNPHFAWQEGYGAFSVGLSNLEQVKGYIRNQAKHHDKQGFVEEYNAMLRAFGLVPYGEKE